MWCVAKLDKEYIQRMEDVLKVYEKPLSEREPVVCIDEKLVVTHQDTRAPLPARPARVARRDYEYKRRGTANVLCGVLYEKLDGLLWDRFAVHFTPQLGSWLNQAEIDASLFSRLCLGKRRIPNLAIMRNQVHACGLRLNRARTTIEWNFTRKHARRKLHYSFIKTRC